MSAHTHGIVGNEEGTHHIMMHDVVPLGDEEREHINTFLLDADVYDIANVANYGTGHVQRETHLIYGRDLPNVAPLGPRTWLEYERTSVPGSDFLGEDIRTFAIVLFSYDRMRDAEMFERWLRMTLLTGLDRDGAPPVSKVMRDLVTVNAFFAFLAVTMAHCKNVGQTEHQPSRQQRRFRERHGGPPLCSWRTIDIFPGEHLSSTTRRGRTSARRTRWPRRSTCRSTCAAT
jgi:hypothetical protein